MNTQKYLSTLKIFPTLLGLTSISVLTSLPGLASQSSPLSNASTQLIAEAEVPQELSPAALKVLCENFPLNSRCTGEGAESAEETTTSDNAPADAESPVSADEAPAESQDIGDAPESDSVDTAADEIDSSAEGGAEEPVSPEPAASDAPTNDPVTATDELDSTPEGGAEQLAAPEPAGSEATPDAVTPDASAPAIPAPMVTPPISGPEGGEGGAEQPTSDTEAAPEAPTEEPSAEGGAEQLTSDTEAAPEAPTEEPSAEGGAEQLTSDTEAAPEAPTEEPSAEATEQPTSTSPAETPSAETLQPETDATSDEQSSISEDELKQFATAIPQLSSLEKATKGEISQVIGQSGLSQDKFNALYNGQQTGSPAVEATDAEKQSFEQAITKIQAIEEKGQAEQIKVIRSQGLEPQRFSQILAAVRQDQALRTKVQQMLQTN